MPFALGGRIAQDAVPYLAAGHLAKHHPSEVYAARHGDLFDLRPGFRTAWCRSAPPGSNCDDLAVAFVATPPVIPLAMLLAATGDRPGMLLMQFGAAAMLSAGMWILWRRLAHRTPHAPQLLAASALLLTPMAMVPIGLGQTSPILFLSLCIGPNRKTTRGRVASAAAWAAACGLKVFPLALAPILLWRRHLRILGSGLGVLAGLSVLTLVLVHPSVWGDFVRTTLQLNGHTTTNPYNGAIDAFVARLFGPGDPGTSVALVARGVTVAGGAAVCWFGMRGTDDDTRWAAGYLALLLVTPLVWWHYVWVVIGAIGVVLAAQRRLGDRVLAILPVTAAISVAPSIPNGNGHSWPQVQAILLIAAAVVFCVLARRSARPRASVSPASAG